MEEGIQYVQFDLGRYISLYQIIMIADQSPPGYTEHYVTVILLLWLF